jgi:6-pyruvoyltetrahydropterin/6-carboxytetrahydropterin synthase
MYEVSVDETFAAAHNLRGYKGKCEDLHGHNYKVRVTLQGKELDSVGLLYDFVHLKQVIHGVIGALDHKYLNELKPFDVLNPSAENIARYIYDETSKQLRQAPSGTGVASITVWESDVTAATYRPEPAAPPRNQRP